MSSRYGVLRYEDREYGNMCDMKLEYSCTSDILVIQTNEKKFPNNKIYLNQSEIVLLFHCMKNMEILDWFLPKSNPTPHE